MYRAYRHAVCVCVRVFFSIRIVWVHTFGFRLIMAGRSFLEGEGRRDIAGCVSSRSLDDTDHHLICTGMQPWTSVLGRAVTAQ